MAREKDQRGFDMLDHADLIEEGLGDIQSTLADIGETLLELVQVLKSKKSDLPEKENSNNG